MLRASTRWPHIAATGSPPAYLRRMVVNEHVSWRRKWARLIPHAVMPIEPPRAITPISSPIAMRSTACSTRCRLANARCSFCATTRASTTTASPTSSAVRPGRCARTRAARWRCCASITRGILRFRHRPSYPEGELTCPHFWICRSYSPSVPSGRHPTSTPSSPASNYVRRAALVLDSSCRCSPRRPWSRWRSGAMTFLGASGNTADRSAGRAVPPRHVQWRFSIGAVQGWTVQRVTSMWMPNNAGTAGDWGQAAELTPTRGRYRVIYGREPTTVRIRAICRRTWRARRGGRREHGSVGARPARRHRDLAAGVRKHPWEAVTASGDPQPSLRWRNSDGSWNMLIGTVGFRPRSLDFDNAVAKRAFLRIAAAVTVATSTHYVAVPFHVALSPRFRPTEMNSTRGVSCASWTTTDAVVRAADCRRLP